MVLCWFTTPILHLTWCVLGSSSMGNAIGDLSNLPEAQGNYSINSFILAVSTFDTYLTYYSTNRGRSNLAVALVNSSIVPSIMTKRCSHY